MANDYIPRRDGQFHAWQHNFGTYVNGHPADWGLAAGVMGAEIWVRVPWVSRPRGLRPLRRYAARGVSTLATCSN
jgi:hypothetical protein